MKQEILDKIKFVVENYQLIPIDEWTTTETNNERKVVWILDRQKPSIDADYSFDEERLGITHKGEIIYGFDSGGSCPTQWLDCGDSVYTEKTWKALELDMKDLNEFDEFEESDAKNLDRIADLIRVKLQ